VAALVIAVADLLSAQPSDFDLDMPFVGDPSRFLDVENPETLSFLERELSSELLALGYAGNLDLSDVRNRDRRLSRAIAAWAYTAQDDVGDALYSGIRYRSRVDDSRECWAVFEGTTVEVSSGRAIELSDPDLQAVADAWDLRAF
jgi:hypothetical protein